MIIQELKKIFALKKMIFILMLAALFYILFFQRLVGIPSYSSERIDLEISKELVRKYGSELDESEYKDLLDHYIYVLENGMEENRIDQWIKQNETFKYHGIESYGELIKVQSALPDDIAISLTSQINTLFSEEDRQAATEEIMREDYIQILVDAYETAVNRNEGSGHDTAVKTGWHGYCLKEVPEDRQRQIAEEERYSLMPDSVMRRYLMLLPDFAIFLFLSMILLIVPYSVKDVMEGTDILQYASQKGYSFYWKKLGAALISAVILCAMEAGLFLVMLDSNNALYFVDCFVSGFRNTFAAFMKLTFGQYIVMSLMYISAAGLGLSLITYGLSSLAGNYISAIAFQIPAVIFSIVISLTIMPHFAEITQNIAVAAVIPLVCLLAAVVGNVGRFVLLKRPRGK